MINVRIYKPMRWDDSKYTRIRHLYNRDRVIIESLAGGHYNLSEN